VDALQGDEEAAGDDAAGVVGDARGLERLA